MLPLVFALFEHVLDRWLVDHQVGSAILADYLDARLVVPFDDATDFLAILQHDDHWCLRLHLLLVIEVFSVGLLWRCGLASARRARRAVSAAVTPTVTAVKTALRTIMPLGTVATFRHRHMVGVVIAVVVIHA